MSPRLRLYLARYSVNCHGPWILLEWLSRRPGGPSYEVVEVDIVNAGHMRPELLKLNPNHTVPTLYDVEEEKAVWESNAILRHLVERFGPHEDLYPTADLAEAAAVDAALEFRTDLLYPAIEDFAYVALGFSQEKIASAPRTLAGVLDELCQGFLSASPGAGGFVGGRHSPSIADVSIAPCLVFLEVARDADQVPRVLRDYLRRFHEAMPWAEEVARHARDYVRMRADMGYAAGRRSAFQGQAAQVLAPEALPFRRFPPAHIASHGLTLACGTDIESVAARLFVEVIGHGSVSVLPHPDPAGGDYRPSLIDPEVGIAVAGGHALARHLARKGELARDQRPTQATAAWAGADTVLEFSHLLRRKIEDAALGSVKSSRTVPSLLRALDALLQQRGAPFFDGDHPGIADCTVYACLRAWISRRELTDAGFSQGLWDYQLRMEAWRPPGPGAETLGWRAAAAEAREGGQATYRDGHGAAALKALVARSQGEDHDHRGPIHLDVYRSAEDALPPSHLAWDELGAHLHEHYRNLDVRRRIDALPVLAATPDALPDRYLARASSLLALFGHAYWHNEHDNPVDSLPASVSEPWLVVTRRLGRAAPTMNYMDLYLHNWWGEPSSVSRMRLRTPTTGSVAEQRFYLGTVAISHAGLPIVDLAARAEDEARAGDEPALRRTLGQIGQCIKRMSEVFAFLSLQQNNLGYVDPVHWTMTVATFAMTFTHKVGLPKAIAPSGNSLPIIHYIDTFLGRSTYDSELGRLTQGFRNLSVMAPNHLACIDFLKELKVREFVADPARDPETHRAWNALVREYAGPGGMLEIHLKKTFGFIMCASLVGRPTTLLNFPLDFRKFQETTREVADLLVGEMELRRELYSTPETPAVPPQGRPRPATRDADQDPGVLPRFTEIDLAFHNTPEKGFWVAIGTDVVDLTSFLYRHPGGHHVLLYQAGLDATRTYEVVHSKRKVPPEWIVGTLAPLADAGPRVALVRLLTMCMNVCAFEFRSICEHKCASDPYTEFDATQHRHDRSADHDGVTWTPYVSPYNLMLLLRYFRKIYFDVFPGVLDAAAELMKDEAEVAAVRAIRDEPSLRQLSGVTKVEDGLRLADAREGLGASLCAVNTDLLRAFADAREAAASTALQGGPIGADARSRLVACLGGCTRPAVALLGIYGSRQSARPGAVDRESNANG